MSNPYLLLSSSSDYAGKLLVGKSATSYSVGCGLTDKSTKIVEVPQKFDGKEIAELGWYSLARTSITSVFISKTVICICRGAFELCKSLSEVKFEEGSKLQSFGIYSFNTYPLLKKIDFHASVVSISTDSVLKFFQGASLECFSYAGIADFSSLIYFINTDAKIYVSNNYPASTFAGINVTKGNTACGVSWNQLKNSSKNIKCSLVIRRNIIQYQNYMFLLIHSI